MPESIIFHHHMALDHSSQQPVTTRPQPARPMLSVETNNQVVPSGHATSSEASESSDSPSPRGSTRDSSWLQVEVCRDFRRDTCPRGELCRFAHPDARVVGRDGKVTCCYDFLKSRCNRDFCKYYHPPAHIKDKLVNAGRQFGAMMSNATRYPSMSWDGYGVKSSHPVVLSPLMDRLPVCQEFLAGYCYLAAMCSLAHPGPYVHSNVDQTVTLCRNFMRGLCARGNKCRFYHPTPQNFTAQHHQGPVAFGIPYQEQHALNISEGQNMPMMHPQLMPTVYFPPSSPMRSPPAPVVAVPISPTPGFAPPPVPVVPVIPQMLSGPIPSPPFIPPQQVMVTTPVSVISSSVTETATACHGEHDLSKDQE